MTAPLPRRDTAPRLRQEVLDWFVRRQAGGWSAQDEAAFTAWLAADAAHRAAHADWSSQWKAVDALPADTVAALRRELARDKALEAPSPVTPAAANARPGRPGRRAFLVPAFSAAAVAAVTGTGWFAWHQLQAQPTFAQTFATARGQQQELSLPDGSRLRLDTATQLRVTYFRQRREVRLLEGRAVFAARPDASRPFHVLAGPLRVTVVGTRFSVRHTPALPGAGGVQVAVDEGRVQVGRFDAAPDKEPPDPLLLTAGQQVASDAHGLLRPVTAVPAEGIAPWREHRVSFVDMPLAHALAELERYGSTGLVVRDPGVAALRLTGTFDPRDTATLRRVLPSALAVRLRDEGSVAEVVPAP